MSALKVWSRFTRKTEDGSSLELRIQDLPSDRYQEALEFMKDYYIPEEAIQKAAGISKNYEAMAERLKYFRELIMSKPTVYPIFCCLDDDLEKPQILGISTVELTTGKEAHKQFKQMKAMLQSKEMVKFIEILDDLYTYKSILETYGFEEYYVDRGMSVHTGYRGLGIATEFVKQRRQMCINAGVPMTIAWMTSLGTQKAAQKEGWETVAEVNFEELGRRLGVVFETAASFNKLMICRV